VKQRYLWQIYDWARPCNLPYISHPGGVILMVGRNFCTDSPASVIYISALGYTWFFLVSHLRVLIAWNNTRIFGCVHVINLTWSSLQVFYTRVSSLLCSASGPLLTKVRTVMHCAVHLGIYMLLNYAPCDSSNTRASETGETETTKLVCKDWRQYHDGNSKYLLVVVSLYSRTFIRLHVQWSVFCAEQATGPSACWNTLCQCSTFNVQHRAQ